MEKISKLDMALILLALSACVVEPAGYYDSGPPAPDYGYYGYAPAAYPYPWDTGVAVDIGGGWGHGGYYGRGGYGGGRAGTVRGGRAGVARGGHRW